MNLYRERVKSKTDIVMVFEKDTFQLLSFVLMAPLPTLSY